MPSALSYGCKCHRALLTAAECQHALLTAAKCQHALLTAAECQHALANLNGEFATIQTTEQALGAAE